MIVLNHKYYFLIVEVLHFYFLNVEVKRNYLVINFYKKGV